MKNVVKSENKELSFTDCHDFTASSNIVLEMAKLVLEPGNPDEWKAKAP